MPKEQIHIWKCDLCNLSKQIYSPYTIGWLDVKVVDMDASATVKEKTICPNCVKEIVEALEKK